MATRIHLVFKNSGLPNNYDPTKTEVDSPDFDWNPDSVDVLALEYLNARDANAPRCRQRTYSHSGPREPKISPRSTRSTDNSSCDSEEELRIDTTAIRIGRIVSQQIDKGATNGLSPCNFERRQ